ncbi:MAG: GspH/FimT family pseudopilin [Geminicoccaceae bacterium]
MGSQANQRGFTLLELLVVLAIIGFVVTLVPGFVLQSQPQLDVEVAARAMAQGLRQVRSEAILHNRPQAFALDVEARVFRAGEQTPVRIDDGIALSFEAARSQLLGEAVGQIRFFPDGSSTGGLIRLIQGEALADVRSDWLTGLVTVDVAVE